MARNSRRRRRSTARPKKIKLAQLISKVGTGKISEEEVGRYFFATPQGPQDYVPRLAINATAVDIGDKEQIARQIGSDLGYKAVEAVRQANRVRAGAPAPDGTILAEGDSWFNLPEFGFPINVPPTLIDILAATFPINNIAHWGDTLAQIVNSAEYVPYLQTGKVECFLFSGGGNDVLGGGNLASLLHQRESGDNDPANAHKYLNPHFDKALDDVMFLYDVLIENVRQLSRKTTVLIHGYDYCLPVRNGQWLGRSLEFRGFSPTGNKAICRAVIREMLNRFNERLEDLANSSGNRVQYISLFNTVKTAWWDELHPNKNAVKKLAKKFEGALP